MAADQCRYLIIPDHGIGITSYCTAGTYCTKIDTEEEGTFTSIQLLEFQKKKKKERNRMDGPGRSSSVPLAVMGSFANNPMIERIGVNSKKALKVDGITFQKNLLL